jgi:hypothetical protein
MDMAMPAMSHLDTPPLSSLHSSPRHHVQHVDDALLDLPVHAVDREDADRARTTRAHDVPGAPRAAW